LSRNERGRFGALKSDSNHHFFRNACTKSGSLRFSGCWLILSVYILMSFDFPFVRLCSIYCHNTQNRRADLLVRRYEWTYNWFDHRISIIDRWLLLSGANNFSQICSNICIIRVIKLPNSEQSYKGKIKTHKYIHQIHIHKVSYVYKHFIGHSYNKPTVSVDHGIVWAVMKAGGLAL
jgi:hypothetical protein